MERPANARYLGPPLSPVSRAPDGIPVQAEGRTFLQVEVTEAGQGGRDKLPCGYLSFERRSVKRAATQPAAVTWRGSGLAAKGSPSDHCPNLSSGGEKTVAVINRTVI